MEVERGAEGPRWESRPQAELQVLGCVEPGTKITTVPTSCP